ncbi:MAG: hypothetical protein ACK4GN_12630 [Runella sp.]
MNKVQDMDFFINITIYGEQFSPQQLLSTISLPLENCIEKGDIVFIKEHKKEYNNGSAEIKIEKGSVEEKINQFNEVLDLLVANREIIREMGGSTISIWVVILRSLQGNWETTSEQIKKIAQIGSSLSITYYQSEQ